MLLLFGDEMLFVVLLCFRVETSSGDAARACGVLHLESILMLELFLFLTF